VSILAAGVAGTVYLAYLLWCRKKLGTDLVTFLSDGPSFIKRTLGLLLALLHTAAAGFIAAVTAEMIKESLIREESYALILLLLLAAASYAVAGDISSRARVYEILFWFVAAPLVIMLLLAAKEIDLSYYVPRQSADSAAVAKSAYAAFGCFGAMFAVLFLPLENRTDPSRRRKERELLGTTCRAFWTAVVILLASYYVMLGTFGANALATFQYPVITLMSMIQFKGGFLKRLDAIMLAVWFFTLFALLSMNLYYGSLLLLGSGRGRTGTKRELGVCRVAVSVLAFVAGLLAGNWEGAQELFVRFFLYVQMPLYILLPGVFAAMAPRCDSSGRGGDQKDGTDHTGKKD
jgi:spore germination protein